MKIIRPILTSYVLALNCISYLYANEGNYKIVYESEEARVNAIQEQFDWHEAGCSELIKVLVDEKKSGRKSFPIYGYHFNWVKESDIVYLMTLVDSRMPCVQVSLYHSSRMPTDSTVGDEAMRMIVAFWKRYYPVFSAQGERKLVKKEIEVWYRVWKRGQRGDGGEKGSLPQDILRFNKTEVR